MLENVVWIIVVVAIGAHALGKWVSPHARESGMDQGLMTLLSLFLLVPFFFFVEVAIGNVRIDIPLFGVHVVLIILGIVYFGHR